MLNPRDHVGLEDLLGRTGRGLDDEIDPASTATFLDLRTGQTCDCDAGVHTLKLPSRTRDSGSCETVHLPRLSTTVEAAWGSCEWAVS